MIAAGCHARFEKRVANIDQVQLKIETFSPLDIDLGRVYTTDPRLEFLADAANLEIWMQEAELERVLGDKVDREQLQSAFQYGAREALGEGPPFAAVDQADHVLDLIVVDWGIEMVTWRGPAVFSYRVRVTGLDPDHKVFYRANFKCYGDPGQVRWLDRGPNRDALAALDPADVQRSFDLAANRCGQQFAEQLRRHAGIY